LREKKLIEKTWNLTLPKTQLVKITILNLDYKHKQIRRGLVFTIKFNGIVMLRK